MRGLSNVEWQPLHSSHPDSNLTSTAPLAMGNAGATCSLPETECIVDEITGASCKRDGSSRSACWRMGQQDCKALAISLQRSSQEWLWAFSCR
jgi:hypothetical protein